MATPAAFDPNRWTLKTREAFQAATADAVTRNNPEVTPANISSLRSSPHPTVSSSRSWKSQA